MNRVPELEKGDGIFISSPQHYRAYDTPPRIRDKLGGANVVKLQDHPDCRMDGETKAGVKGSPIEDHLIQAGWTYGLALLGHPNLNI